MGQLLYLRVQHGGVSAAVRRGKAVDIAVGKRAHLLEQRHDASAVCDHRRAMKMTPLRIGGNFTER